MNVYLINTPDLPIPGSHYLHTKNFLESFRYFGYKYNEIDNVEELSNIEDTKTNIFYISDHGFHYNQKPNTIEILSSFKESIFLLWHLHNNLDYLSTKFNKWILTGEHFRRIPISESHRRSYDLQLTLNNYVPLTFASNLHPSEIKPKEDISKYKYDCNYIGHYYNVDWSEHLKNNLNTFIRYTPPFISEDVRVQSFKDSFASLGFQSKGNVENNCITERIFEALSYGCLLFVDSEHIEEEIKGGVILVTSPQEIVDKINYYQNNLEEANIIINTGIEYVKNKGTYFHTCQNFLNKIKFLYD